jgi:hypothetical protein
MPVMTTAVIIMGITITVKRPGLWAFLGGARHWRPC